MTFKNYLFKKFLTLYFSVKKEKFVVDDLKYADISQLSIKLGEANIDIKYVR